MALTVEDGTIVTGAQSYVSIDEANAYHTAMQNTDWDNLADAEKETALTLATRSVDQLYGERYMSVVRSETQKLLFPRSAFYDRHFRYVSDTTIPQALKDAVCEIAYLYATGVDIFPAENTDNTVGSYSVTLGSISESTTYRQAKNIESYPNFRKVDLAIAAICRQSQGNWRLVA